MRTALLVATLSICSAACGVSPGDGSGGGDDAVGTPENPVPAKTGPYTLTNKIDFTVEQILPQQVEAVVLTLREMETNPAHALISIADRAGVPAVGALYGAIPGILKDKLEDWINGEINKVQINGKPIGAYCGQIAKLAETALTDFQVDSELAIEGGTATHRLTALDLRPTGIVNVRIPIGGFVGDLLTQTPSIDVSEGGAFTLTEQHFGLNYGEYAWQGIEAVSTQLFGGTVRQTLGKAINCPALAHTIASKCVLGVCVSHETELNAICEGGLDAAVDLVHDKLADMRIEALHLASGSARLVDEDGDGVGDSIVDGAWDAEMNLGLGLRKAPATFTGTR
jgi:hypothetical protein